MITVVTFPLTFSSFFSSCVLDEVHCDNGKDCEIMHKEEEEEESKKAGEVAESECSILWLGDMQLRDVDFTFGTWSLFGASL